MKRTVSEPALRRVFKVMENCKILMDLAVAENLNMKGMICRQIARFPELINALTVLWVYPSLPYDLSF